MGAELGPGVAVAGALEGVRRHGVRVALVGDGAALRAEVEKQGVVDLLDRDLRVVHAPDVVTMEDKPSVAVRHKKQSSMFVAVELCRVGETRGVVSPGHSGVFMGMAVLGLGRIRGVLRPSIATTIPRPSREDRTVLLDSGANTVAAPGHLVQWAFLGEAYARVVLGRPRPTVALLSNGEEETKGTDVTRMAHAALKQTRDHLDYGGYCEGRDLPYGLFDVVVTDGFTGNIVLKTIEGAGKGVKDALEERFRRSLLSKLQYLVVHNIFAELKRRTDHRLLGGAPLLGVDGVAIVTHGKSDALAIGHALRVAKLHVNNKLNDAIAESVAVHDRLFPDAKRMAIAHARALERATEEALGVA
jgi:glycerol-3-phosphate acyltransferase PlsX